MKTHQLSESIVELIKLKKIFVDYDHVLTLKNVQLHKISEKEFLTTVAMVLDQIIKSLQIRHNQRSLKNDS